jgi:hypothetical protein
MSGATGITYISASLVLSEDELFSLTGYRRPSEQLAELHRQGFSRARRNRFGRLVLERAHYDAVCAGQKPDPARPKVKPPMLRPT